MPTTAEQRARAIEWLVSLQQQLPQSRIQEWEHWIADPSHRAIFDEITEVWRRAGSIGPLTVPDASELAGDEYDGSESIAAWRAREALDAPTQLEGGAVDAPSEQGERISLLPQLTSRRRSHRRPLVAAAAAASIAALSWIVYPLLTPSFTSEPQFYETTLAEHRSVTLEDGSEVLLGARTSLWVTYTPQRRIVVLDGGEALFDVERDPSRPFSVRAGHGTITALGTSFSVQRDREQVKVTVAEGVVQVEPPLHERKQEHSVVSDIETARPVVATVTKGQQVRYDERGTGSVSIVRVGAEFATAWGEGRLQYINEPLDNVTADVNRYSRRRIVFDDPRVHDLRFTGVIFQRNASEWGEQLTDIFPTLEVAEANAEHVVLRVRPRDGDG